MRRGEQWLAQRGAIPRGRRAHRAVAKLDSASTNSSETEDTTGTLGRERQGPSVLSVLTKAAWHWSTRHGIGAHAVTGKKKTLRLPEGTLCFLHPPPPYFFPGDSQDYNVCWKKRATGKAVPVGTILRGHHPSGSRCQVHRGWGVGGGGGRRGSQLLGKSFQWFRGNFSQTR